MAFKLRTTPGKENTRKRQLFYFVLFQTPQTLQPYKPQIQEVSAQTVLEDCMEQMNSSHTPFAFDD
jgi:hypothetical protein